MLGSHALADKRWKHLSVKPLAKKVTYGAGAEDPVDRAKM